MRRLLGVDSASPNYLVPEGKRVTPVSEETTLEQRAHRSLEGAKLLPFRESDFHLEDANGDGEQLQSGTGVGRAPGPRGSRSSAPRV